MGETDRNDDGEYTRTVTDEEILHAIRATPAPVVTATELANVLPIGRRAIRERLSALQERELVDRKEVGARAVVWWLVDDSTAARNAETLAERLGGFGLLDDEAGESFADAVATARAEMNEGMEDRRDALFGE